MNRLKKEISDLAFRRKQKSSCTEKIRFAQRKYALHKENTLCTKKICSAHRKYVLRRENMLCTEKIRLAHEKYGLRRENILRTQKICFVQPVFAARRQISCCAVISRLNHLKPSLILNILFIPLIILRRSQCLPAPFRAIRRRISFSAGARRRLDSANTGRADRSCRA